jgi:hypothetical protein
MWGGGGSVGGGCAHRAWLELFCGRVVLRRAPLAQTHVSQRHWWLGTGRRFSRCVLAGDPLGASPLAATSLDVDVHGMHTMAPIDPADDLSDAEANYHESSDEDFHPTTAAVDEPSSSDDEDDAPAKPAKGRAKRKAVADDELDSGDEVTIEAARKRKAKKRKGAEAQEEDELLLSDDGGDGGLVKTRAQRRVEYVHLCGVGNGS